MSRQPWRRRFLVVVVSCGCVDVADVVDWRKTRAISKCLGTRDFPQDARRRRTSFLLQFDIIPVSCAITDTSPNSMTQSSSVSIAEKSHWHSPAISTNHYLPLDVRSIHFHCHVHRGRSSSCAQRWQCSWTQTYGAQSLWLTRK